MPPGGPRASYFPNVPLIDQDGDKALFYRDLVQGKIVTFNVFSTKSDPVQDRITKSLVALQEALAKRPGCNVSMYSISLDPVHDTPYVLRQYAQRFGVKPGWKLLTGRPADVELVLAKLGFHSVQMQDEIMAPHIGLLRYGNETLDRWAAIPATSDPEMIVDMLSLVRAQPEPVDRKRSVRAGPFPSALTKAAAHAHSQTESQ